MSKFQLVKEKLAPFPPKPRFDIPLVLHTLGEDGLTTDDAGFLTFITSPDYSLEMIFIVKTGHMIVA